MIRNLTGRIEPWAVLVWLPALGGVFSGLMLVQFALRHADEPVRDDVERQARMQKTVEAPARRAGELGLSADWSLDPDTGILSVDLAGQAPGNGLNLVLWHATRSELDREVELTRAPDGQWTASVWLPPEVRYGLRLEDPADTWAITGRLEPGKYSGRLEPARR